MPGPVPKDADRRQRRNGPGLVLAGGEAGRIVPDPPNGLLKVTREGWSDFWTSVLVEAVEPATDMPAIRRLFRLRDEHERYRRKVAKEPMVEGSQGQPVLHPLARQMTSLASEIRQLEDRLGLTPKARAQLGITIGAARKTLEELNRDLQVDEEDPRE